MGSAGAEVGIYPGEPPWLRRCLSSEIETQRQSQGDRAGLRSFLRHQPETPSPMQVRERNSEKSSSQSYIKDE